MADNTQNYLMIAAASAFLGGGGTHLATSDQDTPLNTTSIQDCTPFSQHAREHEQHKCQALINSIKLDCKD